ncbi:MAG: hypothetical protein APF80_02375 [Alphaproteobacteria bacterium BRH_c36]|nr:MAG: hypothetical protein APF80_02375 [Alphaproteobacteria bacterium BRH_c36]
MMRLIAIVALAACFVPRETLISAAQSAYEQSIDIVTLCQRRPEECREIGEKINQAGVLLTDFSSTAAVRMQSLLEAAVERLQESGAVSAADRGTLSEEDRMPAWRGH